jgi:CRISPR-associated endonuclease Csn1
LIAALMMDWHAIPSPEIKLPARYQGGLLFGQLVPRFENRIIARCPITYERIYQCVLDETGDEIRAKDDADKLAKVPSAACPEFFRYRWAMQLANVLVHTPTGACRLTLEQRRALDETVRQRGAFTKGEFKKVVRALTGGAPDNLDQMLSHPDAERALVLDPVQRLLADKDIALLVAALPASLQARLRGQLRRGRRLTLSTLRIWTVAANESAAFDGAIDRQLDAINTRRTKKAAELTREILLATVLQVHALTGRAPHSREVMREVVDFAFNDPAGRHPTEDGCPLYRSDIIRAAQLQRAIDEQTNNHLVRHRLRLLDRLHRDLLRDYADADPIRAIDRIDRVTIEVNRDLRDLSGQTAQDIAKDEGARLKNFKDVAAKVTELLGGHPTRNFASLVRKARIATDLGCRCPYTGRNYDLHSVVAGEMALDHIIPYSVRPSNSLDSLVVTFPRINEKKGNRTGLEFVQWANLPENHALRDDLGIWTENQYRAFVEGLDTKGHDDDKRRKRNRKRLLLLRDYVEKEFIPGDLTQTSQLVRLGAQILEKTYMSVEPSKRPVFTSLPGSITGAVRKSWRLTGSLEAGNSNILDPSGAPRTKTEIRDITHLHHALDACVLVFAAHFLPGKARDGGAWQLLVKRRLTPDEQTRAHELFHGYIEFGPKGEPRLIDLPKTYKKQIHDGLAQRRVVQHIPAEFAGLRAEQNAWRVLGPAEDGQILLRQRIRQPDGTRPLKERKEKHGKLIGLHPGKLQSLKAALVVADNYGLALDPEPEIIPFHKVWVRLRELREKNGGRSIRVLRNGMLIKIPTGKYTGIWRIFSLKNNTSGLALDIGRPDVVRLRNKTEGHKINVLLASLLRDGLKPLDPPLCGVDASDKRNPPPA